MACGVQGNSTTLHVYYGCVLISLLYVQVIKLMQSFKSRELVTELFAWRHYYWFLTDEGIEYLRVYLNLPSEIVPATLKKSTRPLEKDGGRPPRREGGYGDRPPRREGGFGGDRRSVWLSLVYILAASLFVNSSSASVCVKFMEQVYKFRCFRLLCCNALCAGWYSACTVDVYGNENSKPSGGSPALHVSDHLDYTLVIESFTVSTIIIHDDYYD